LFDYVEDDDPWRAGLRLRRQGVSRDLQRREVLLEHMLLRDVPDVPRRELSGLLPRWRGLQGHGEGDVRAAVTAPLLPKRAGT
jgi:hypothetical protein